MTPKIVDASALAAICFAEPEGASIATRFTGAKLFSTGLLDFELANICWKRTRRDPDRVRQYRVQLSARNAFQIEIIAVPFDEVVALAVATDLTAYDASYLWLARHLNAELVTLDRRLERAAQTAA